MQVDILAHPFRPFSNNPEQCSEPLPCGPGFVHCRRPKSDHSLAAVSGTDRAEQ